MKFVNDDGYVLGVKLVCDVEGVWILVGLDVDKVDNVFVVLCLVDDLF